MDRVKCEGRGRVITAGWSSPPKCKATATRLIEVEGLLCHCCAYHSKMYARDLKKRGLYVSVTELPKAR